MDMGVESLLLSWRALRRRGGDAVKGEEGEKLKLGKQKAQSRNPGSRPEIGWYFAMTTFGYL